MSYILKSMREYASYFNLGHRLKEVTWRSILTGFAYVALGGLSVFWLHRQYLNFRSERLRNVDKELESILQRPLEERCALIRRQILACGTPNNKALVFT
jgi:hypothetical protein